VWGTFSNLHRIEGEKECSTHFLPICTVGKKSVGYTPSTHLHHGGAKEWGAHFFSLEGISVETQKVKIKYLRSNNNVKWHLIAVLEIGHNIRHQPS